VTSRYFWIGEEEIEIHSPTSKKGMRVAADMTWDEVVAIQ
jgi:hypothetical protein